MQRWWTTDAEVQIEEIQEGAEVRGAEQVQRCRHADAVAEVQLQILELQRCR